ncbi:BAHD acyltransferase At5g47980 [Linum grandiflorum]
MSHFLSSSPAPNIQLLRQLAPPRPKMMSVHNMPLACFQMTAFRCGGLAVGISLNHLIADGHTFSLFLNHWAAVYKGDYNHGRLNKLTNAEDMASSLFPINDTILKSKPLSWCKQEKDLMHPDIVLRRFVFKSDKISALKSRVESSEVPNPSRAIAIFGLIWKTAMNACKTTMSMSSALLVVNLRPRLINTTPLTYYSIGNLHWGVVSSYDHSTKMLSTTDELKGLVARLKKSVEEVDAEFVESLKGENGHEKINKWLEGRGKGKEYVFTSVIKMGLNEIDFGWGEPIWVGFLGLTDVPSPDGVCLIDGTTTTNCGGVEAWVSLAKEEMDSFEQDHDLLKYATVNPIVLINSL